MWHLLSEDPRLRFRLLVLCSDTRQEALEHIYKTLPLKEVGTPWAAVFRWDLAILADHEGRGIVDAWRCPVLRVQHGIPGKRVSGEVYAFGRDARDARGSIRYTRIFVSSTSLKDLAVSIDPSYEDAIAVVGSLGDDRLLAENTRREEYRERLGLQPDDIAVLVMSTYGPTSLFHRVGDALLAEALRLQDQFRFILSAHPAEYRPRGPGERVWGEFVESQAEHGFLVRRPSESWVPYVIVCDIVLTDHTSVSVHGAILGRPLVFVPIAEGAVEPGSVIQQLRDISPVIQEDSSDLRDALFEALNSYPFDKMRDLVDRMNSCPGQAASRMRQEAYALLGLDMPDAS